MRAKDALNGLCGNLTSKFIQRCGRSLQGCNSIVDSYTRGLEQYFGTPSNSKPSLQKNCIYGCQKRRRNMLESRGVVPTLLSAKLFCPCV